MMLWMVCSVLGLVIEDYYIGESGQGGTLNQLMTSTGLTTESGEPGNFKLTAALVSPDFYKAMASVISFNFAFFTGAWSVFRWIFFIPLAVGIGVNVVWTAMSHIPLFGRGSGGS